MTDVLIFGDTVRHATLRHEIPLGIGDEFLYLEANGKRAAVVSVLERDRVEQLGLGLELIAPEELGADDLLAQGLTYAQVQVELALRAAQRLGVKDATVPPEFPVALADRLRGEGIALAPDAAFFDARRRIKNELELAGIRRAQAAAEAGMGSAATLLREARPGAKQGDPLTLPDGEELTAERLRAAIREACANAGAPATADTIVAPGAQSCSGHESGHGPLLTGLPIVIDLWPGDEESGCHADMTRTFVVGDVDPRTAEQHALARESLENVRAAAKPGITGRALWELSCEPFERAGHPTQRTKESGTVLDHGFYHGLGHGVGLEVHEGPALGRSGREDLVAGDVVAVEPGSYEKETGGVRLEDLLLITPDGCETLTDFPYELTP